MNKDNTEGRIKITSEMAYFEKGIEVLKAYPWLGNVREVFSMIKSMPS